MSVIKATAPVEDRRVNHPSVPGEPVSVEQFVADVLRRAHRTAEAVHELDEARAILHIAHLFAEELAKTHARFDRHEFIHGITREPA